jgi:hypothetical protein
VFIAFSSVIVIDFLRLPHRKFVEPGRERRVKRALLAIVLITGLPSIYLAVRLVDNEVFSSRARDFVRKEFKEAQVHVLETRVLPGTRDIEVTLIGPRLPGPAIKAIEGRMAGAGLRDGRLFVHQVQGEDNKIDVGTLKADILADIVRNNQQTLQEKDAALETLKGELDRERDWKSQANAIALEFEAQYPQCGNTLVGRAWSADGGTAKPIPFLNADCRRMPNKSDVARVTEWLKVRTGSGDAKVLMAASRERLVRKNDGRSGT